MLPMSSFKLPVHSLWLPPRDGFCHIWALSDKRVAMSFTIFPTWPRVEPPDILGLLF